VRFLFAESAVFMIADGKDGLAGLLMLAGDTGERM
jgi:hypothetical protein